MRKAMLAAAVVGLVGCGLDTEGTAEGTDASATAGGSGGVSTTDASWQTGGTGGGAGSAGAAGGGAVAGAAGSGGVVSAGGTGGGGPTEDCANGKDDDADGLVDCADSDCVGTHLCVPDTPGGWTGPIVVALGNVAAPTCPADFPDQALVGGVLATPQPAVTCPTCACDASTATCGDPKVTSYGSSNCGSQARTNHTFTGCQAFSPGSDQSSFKLELGAAGGMCAAQSTGAMSKPPLAFTTHILGCAAGTQGAGCGAGAKCTRRPPAGFGRVCLHRTGNHACTPGWTEKTLLSANVVDNRSCTPCGCGAAACSATATAYDDSACVTALGKTLSAPGCAVLDSAENTFSVLATKSVSCPPTGGTVTGAITGTETTLCCRP